MTQKIAIKKTESKIVLASASLARKKLMEKLKTPFMTVASGFHENMETYTDPKKLALFLAQGKAEFIAHRFPEKIIIGADTFILVGRKKIGKPSSLEEAKKILKQMSDRTIAVYTGLAVVKTDSSGHIEKIKITCEITKLKIKKMSEEEIEFLATQEEALKISGAFSIEGPGGKMVEKIEGDYDNVIGLPMKKLKTILKKF